MGKHSIDLDRATRLSQELVSNGMLVFKNTLLKQGLDAADELFVYHLALSIWLFSYRQAAGIDDGDQTKIDLIVRHATDKVRKGALN